MFSYKANEGSLKPSSNVKRKLYCWFITLSTSATNPWLHDQMETYSALLALCARIHRSPMNSPHKGQLRGALKFSVELTMLRLVIGDAIRLIIISMLCVPPICWGRSAEVVSKPRILCRCSLYILHVYQWIICMPYGRIHPQFAPILTPHNLSANGSIQI